MKIRSDQDILKCWQKNVQPWVKAVRNGEIESRIQVTNNAIVAAVNNRNPGNVLDLGCGEGWLVRELAKLGIDCLGVDGIPELIDYARQAGGGRFQVVPLETLSKQIIKEKFDVIVCNFSLLGHESVLRVFQQTPRLLNEGGAFIVQTIHPRCRSDAEKYEDGWRKGSWSGFADEFCDPAPWYFRTLETWQILFTTNGFRSVEILEPVDIKTNMPASVIFIGVRER